MAAQDKGNKHPLLVYRFIGRRFRPAANLMMLAGVAAQLPLIFPQLQIPNPILPYSQLSGIGILLMLVGLVLWAAAIWREKRAYVQCRPEFLVVHTAGNKTAISYQRIRGMKRVLVRDIYANTKSQRRFIKPLFGETGIEVLVDELPLPVEELRKRMSQFVIDTRDKGFIFIVPKPAALATEIDSYMHATHQQRKQQQAQYRDPIERAQRR